MIYNCHAAAAHAMHDVAMATMAYVRLLLQQCESLLHAMLLDVGCNRTGKQQVLPVMQWAYTKHHGKR